MLFLPGARSLAASARVHTPASRGSPLARAPEFAYLAQQPRLCS